MIPARLLTLDADHYARSQTGPADTYGTPTWVEESPVAFTMWRRPKTVDELAERPDSRSVYIGFWTADLGATSHDRLDLANGESYEIEGVPRHHINPRTGDGYYEADLITYEEET